MKMFTQFFAFIRSMLVFRQQIINFIQFMNFSKMNLHQFWVFKAQLHEFQSPKCSFVPSIVIMVDSCIRTSKECSFQLLIPTVFVLSYAITVIFIHLMIGQPFIAWLNDYVLFLMVVPVHVWKFNVKFSYSFVLIHPNCKLFKLKMFRIDTSPKLYLFRESIMICLHNLSQMLLPLILAFFQSV